MISNKVFILSYKNNGLWPDVLHKCMNIFRLNKFEPCLVQGYNYKKTTLKKNEVVYKGVLDIALPLIKDYLQENTQCEGVFVAEDDCLVRYSYMYIVDKFNLKDENRIVRLGWQTSSGITKAGFTLTYIPRSQVERLESAMKSSKPQHIDMWLSKTNKVKVICVEKSVADELKHVSFITGKVRSKMF